MENRKDLKERTRDFALRIIRMCSSLPDSAEARVIGTQVLRAGTSVGAVYRQASRGSSKSEFVARTGDCLREIDQTAYWLELLIEANILAKNKLSGLLQESKELTAIFTAITKNSKTDAKKK